MKSTDFNFDKESLCIKLFNHIVEIYEFFDCKFEVSLINKYLSYHNMLLKDMQKILEVRKLYLLKHLELLGDQLRNIYIMFTNFYKKEFFQLNHHKEEFICLISKLKEFYVFSNIISKDVLSQISVLIIFFDLRIQKVGQYFKN